MTEPLRGRPQGRLAGVAARLLGLARDGATTDHLPIPTPGQPIEVPRGKTMTPPWRADGAADASDRKRRG